MHLDHLWPCYLCIAWEEVAELASAKSAISIGKKERLKISCKEKVNDTSIHESQKWAYNQGEGERRRWKH